MRHGREALKSGRQFESGSQASFDSKMHRDPEVAVLLDGSATKRVKAIMQARTDYRIDLFRLVAMGVGFFNIVSSSYKRENNHSLSIDIFSRSCT